VSGSKGGPWYTSHTYPTKVPPEAIKPFIEASTVPGGLVADPFCGSGHFLTEALDHVRSNHKSKAADEFAYHKLHGIEESERMVRVAMTDMRLHGDGHANIRCTDALLPFSNYHDIERESFDMVLTNPPFGSVHWDVHLYYTAMCLLSTGF